MFLRAAGRVGLALSSTSLVLLLGTTGVSATTSSADIGSASGPLTHVYIGTDLSCQVSHTGDTQHEFYPADAAPGDCATFLASGGILYAPDFSKHDNTATGNLNGGGATTPYTAVSQTPVSGNGTSAAPYSVTTIETLGSSGLTISETDTYVAGDEYYSTSVTVTYAPPAPAPDHAGQAAAAPPTSVAATLFHAGDCYLQGSDFGYGAIGPTAGEVLCTANPHNVPPGRVVGFIPVTTGSHYTEINFDTMWGQITAPGTQFPDACDCTIYEDNAAGLSWPITVSAGTPTTVSFDSIFSPTGNASTSPTPTPTPSAAVTPTPTAVPTPATGAATTGGTAPPAGLTLAGLAALSGAIALRGRRRRRT